MRVAIVSTYPPRACGIGTFTRDLRTALVGTGGVSTVDVAAIVREEGDQRPEVVASIHQEQRGDYAATARALERRGVDVLMIEHEYGIFGGPDGRHVLSLARELRLPMVLTLHTVLASPSAGQAETLRSLCDLAALVCVFTETARRMVVESGLALGDRIRVVPHGAPSELMHNGRQRRIRLGHRGASSAPAHTAENHHSVLATFGLISRGKGIETAIAAMPAILERHPETVYRIAGQTHPEVAKHEGEEYRLSLERLTLDQGLEEHVLFDDRFLTIDDLASLLVETTIYVTPYRSREQIVSGALTFAIAAGCPTISTPYYYAEDLLASGAGVLVPFDDPDALADAAIGLLSDPQRLQRARRAARAVGHELSWPQVGRQTAGVLREAMELGAPHVVRHTAPATLPRARDSHLLTLIDDVGIVQHADGSIPARISGYCVDDVARLAIVALGLRRTTDLDDYHRILARSLSFLMHAWDPTARGMRNFLSYDRRWLDEPHGGDHLGRAAWALGEVIGADPSPAVRAPTVNLLREMLPALEEQRSPRTMAFAMLGLAQVDPAVLGDRGTALLRSLADRLADQQRANATAEWYWAEDVLAYDDARLPQALIAAGTRLGDVRLRDEGLRALEWYSGQCHVDGPFVRHVGHLGRRRGERAPGEGDEQPINAAALVEAHVEAHEAKGLESDARRAVRAFEWFLGRNRLGLPVYDFATGGCHDGLGETAVNGNQGAESSLAYLQALLTLDAAGLQATLHE